MNQFKELKLQYRFINMLNEYDYNNENNCDIIHIIFNIIYNLTELFLDNPNEIFEEIKKMNKLIDNSNIEADIKKNEKSFLIDIIKNVKLRIKNIQENSNNEDKINDNIEMKKIGNKDSMKIKLKST